MATLALAVAGAAAGSALLPAGASLLGITLSGAAIGSQVGAFAGSLIDQALLGPGGQSRTITGPRLKELAITTSTEGAPLPRLFGRARVGGQVIWATELEEEEVRTSEGGGGKGAPRSTGTTTVEYRYYANFAVALCEGEISGIDRIWADGKELDLSSITWRLYPGSESQAPDSLIVAKQGAGAVPAYLGTAYIVFERLPLADYGNRIPQLSFEVIRAVDGLSRQIRGVTLIPGSGEFVYAPEPVTRTAGGGSNAPENAHTKQGGSNWSVSIDQLQSQLPNAHSVSLIVSWFGDDLRAASCTIRPKVDLAAKQTSPLSWSVAGLSRADAQVVSEDDGRPAYGGTPSDQTVVAAIRDLVDRGLSVVLTPFVLMDIPAANTLADPYTGTTGQPAYPWRGRITVDPAPGRAGTPDKTAAAATQLAAFIGTATPAHFSLFGDTVIYSGPAEWSYRRLILHYAWLAKAAGGVDAFVIGTELRGLTQVRTSTSAYAFVAALVALATDVRAILGSTCKITYAADWSEYFGHQPADGTGDVHFHLDPLWSSSAIDAIGIDLYWPLSDWREGDTHLDRAAGIEHPYDLAYLKSGLTGGEGFDWYYASEADRNAQIRTPISDGLGKPWVFRFKDLKSWWLNPHYNRPGGAESPTPTGWVPQSKPVWLMELGCPAVDKGPNQPNVFVDPKSSESRLPYYSTGQRDDLAQRQYLRAFHEAFDPASPGYVAGANPVSASYAGRMLDLDRLHVYAWDARPYPAFPLNEEVWGDGPRWRLGHWLNGRAAAASLADVVSDLLSGYGFNRHDTRSLAGTVHGLLIDRLMSAREALQPLELAYFFDALESDGRIVFRHRGTRAPVFDLTSDSLVEGRADAPLLAVTRGQETELPSAAKIAHISATADYRQVIAEARRLDGSSSRVASADLALVLESDQALAIAESWLHEAWAAREHAALTLPPSTLALEPGDTIRLTLGGRQPLLRITEITDSGPREIEARSLEPSVYRAPQTPPRAARPPATPISGSPLAFFLDLPLLRGDEPATAGYVAATQTPWPGAVVFYRSADATGFTLAARARLPATTGVTLDPLASGPVGRYDRAARPRIRLDRGTLETRPELQILLGANVLALQGAGGVWEILQFTSATLVAPLTYELSGLLRGQSGSERAMAAPLAAGARVILIDPALARVDQAPSEVGLTFNWRVGPATVPLGGAGTISATHAFVGEGLRPLRVVHPRGRRAAGDLILTWVRRTRIGGDSWDGLDVPLGEESERYEIDILSGTSVVRTLSAATPTATYTLAQQTADFGAAQSAVALRLYQVSATFGRGSPCSVTL